MALIFQGLPRAGADIPSLGVSWRPEMRWLLVARSWAGAIPGNCERTVGPRGALAITAETMFASISCHGDLWLHFAVMEN